jgi:hypothetical protein
MYGSLVYSKDTGLAVHFASWEFEPSVGEEELAARARTVAAFIKKECSGDKAEQQKRIGEDLGYIVPHVRADELNMALNMCRAHNILPDARREKRMDAIKTTIDGLFADLKSPPADLVQSLQVLRRMGTLMPDAFQKTFLETIAVRFRTNLLVDHRKIPPEYKSLLAFMAELGKLTADQKIDEARLVQIGSLLLSVVLSRPPSAFESLKKQITQALSGKGKANVFMRMTSWWP